MKLSFVREVKKCGSPCKPSNVQIKYVDTGSVVNNTIKAFEVYDSSEKPSRANLVVKPGDVLFAKMASSVKVVEIDDINCEYVYSTGFYAFRDTRILPTYLKFFFLSPHFNRLKDKYSQGATMKAINDNGMAKISIEVPNLEVQAKRLGVLTSIWDARNNAYESIRLLDEQIKSLFNEMFPEGHQSPRRTLVSCCKNKDDVKCGPFGTQLSHDEYQTTGIPLYEIAQISSRFGKMPTNFLTPEKAEKLSQYNLLPGDIAMSRKGRVGDCVVVPSHFESGIIHSDVVRIRTDTDIMEPVFLAEQFITSRALQAAVNSVSSGAIMPGINVTKLKNVEVDCPQIELQRLFMERVRQIDKLRFNYQQQIKLLNELLEAKMAEYFGGEE